MAMPPSAIALIRPHERGALAAALANRAAVAPSSRATRPFGWRSHMRRWGLLAAGVIGLSPATSASAAGLIDEARLGVLDHDIGLFDHHAEHGVDVNGELLFASPGLFAPIGAPHPNLGVSV